MKSIYLPHRRQPESTYLTSRPGLLWQACLQGWLWLPKASGCSGLVENLLCPPSLIRMLGLWKMKPEGSWAGGSKLPEEWPHPRQSIIFLYTRNSQHRSPRHLFSHCRAAWCLSHPFIFLLVKSCSASSFGEGWTSPPSVYSLHWNWHLSRWVGCGVLEQKLLGTNVTCDCFSNKLLLSTVGAC